MRKILKPFLYSLPFLIVIAVIAWCLQGENVAVLNPQGIVALKEKHLIIFSTLLMLIVVIPVFILTFICAWKYRASNRHATYTPDWDFNLTVETIWWGLPFAIIVILSVMVWTSSHDLDPFKPLKSDKKPVTVQVVALQWKWLFIYPEHNIATVNYFQIPEKTPVNFEITADAPMNAFWVPQLGTQVYAMPGMRTKLHLMADKPGEFNGVSSNLSGKGFAGMRFIVKSTSQKEYEQWIKTVQASAKPLDKQAYLELAAPSENNPVTSYTLTKKDLFDWIVMKFMMPEGN